MNLNINEKAMLVTLSVKLWTGRKTDIGATNAAVEAMKAKHSAGEFRKKLFPNGEVERVRRAIEVCRKVFRESTLPWLDNGRRLLPAKAHLTFVKKMRAAQAGVRQAKDEFKKNYRTSREEAKRILGKMFVESEYPEEYIIDELFDVQYRVEPVPCADDFRVTDLGQKEVAEIRAEIEEGVKAQVAEGMKEVWVRMKDAVAHLGDRLAGKTEEGKDNIFRDKTVKKFEELCDVLQKLNVGDDKEFDKLAKEVRDTVKSFDPDKLRKDKDARADAAAKTQAMLDKMKGYGL